MEVLKKNQEVIDLVSFDVNRVLWERGTLKWKLRDYQIPVYDSINNSKAVKFVLNISRRFGKTTTLLLDATETALKYPGALIPFIAPEQKMIRRILQPIMALLLADCPEEMTPRYDKNEGAYNFKNGSKIFLAGTDKEQYESLRGINVAHKAYIDEAGFCDNLAYIISDILTPATMTEGGRIIIASTPPKAASHDFYYIAMDAQSLENYIVLDINANTSLDEETKIKYIQEGGGIDSTTVRREYFCEFVTDTESAVVPEFTESKAHELVKEHPRPAAYDIYGALDPGYKDFTAYVLGYYDFLNAKYIVEGSFMIKKANSKKIARAITELEEDCFPGQKAYMRVSDTTLLTISDLATLHGIMISPVRKKAGTIHGSTENEGFKEAAVNRLRYLVQQNRLIISPDNKDLVRQLKTAIWDKTGRKFARTSKEGHFDLIDALIYFILNVNTSKNPFKGNSYEGKYNVMDTEDSSESSIKQLFGL